MRQQPARKTGSSVCASGAWTVAGSKSQSRSRIETLQAVEAIVDAPSACAGEASDESWRKAGTGTWKVDKDAGLGAAWDSESQKEQHI